MSLSQQSLLHLVAILSDGAARTLPSLARAAELSLGETTDALTELSEAGMTVLQEGTTILLPRPFIVLDALRIEEMLRERRARASVVIAAILDSTNSRLMQQTRQGVREGVPMILSTELQSAGRGRQGRTWLSGAGTSLAVSFAFPLATAVGSLSGLSLVCGLAVQEALAARGVAPLLKWPNDILIGHDKVAGILVEVQAVGTHDSVAVIGVGVNIAADPARSARIAEAGGAALPVTDLERAGAVLPIDRNVLIVDLFEALIKRLGTFEIEGFGAFVADYNRAHAYQDLPVVLTDVHTSTEPSVRGIARGVDPLGKLLVDTEDGPRTVVAGDVSLRVA